MRGGSDDRDLCLASLSQSTYWRPLLGCRKAQARSSVTDKRGGRYFGEVCRSKPQQIFVKVFPSLQLLCRHASVLLPQLRPYLLCTHICQTTQGRVRALTRGARSTETHGTTRASESYHLPCFLDSFTQSKGFAFVMRLFVHPKNRFLLFIFTPKRDEYKDANHRHSTKK